MKHSFGTVALLIVAGTATVAALVSAAQGNHIDGRTDTNVMLAAVSSDRSMLSGGISSSNWTRSGTVIVEPLARLTSSGLWVQIPCSTDNQKNCNKFAREYLSKRHIYTVVSADGSGATIDANPTTLSECFDYSGTGNYSGASIEESGIAASSTGIFGDSNPPRLLSTQDTLAIRSSLAELVPRKIDSTRDLRIYSVQLESKEFYVVQRAFTDIPENQSHRLVFGIGEVEPHRFHFLYWKQNTEDESERVLGTIHLKSGQDFLITVVNDPESHFFRVYGIRDNRLSLVYSGGGASC
jgi:hypothetical protein